jgi:hypothetical protein
MTIAVLANGFNRTSVLGLQSSRETRCVRVRRVDQPQRQTIMHDCDSFAPEFDDGRGRYPDRISVNTPKGLRERARGVASKRGVSFGEFVRRALVHAIESADGKPAAVDRGASR